MAIIKTPFNKQLVHRVFHHSSRATFKIFWDLGRPSLQILVIRRLDLMFTVVSQTPIHFSALPQIVTRSSSPPTCLTAVACKGYGGGAPRHASHSCSCCEHVGRPHPAYLRSTPGNQVRRGGVKKALVWFLAAQQEASVEASPVTLLGDYMISVMLPKAKSAFLLPKKHVSFSAHYTANVLH